MGAVTSVTRDRGQKMQGLMHAKSETIGILWRARARRSSGKGGMRGGGLAGLGWAGLEAFRVVSYIARGREARGVMF